MSTANLELFAVTPKGPERLSTPPGTADVNDVFDGLPRGIYEGLRTFDHVRFIGLEEHLDRAQASIAHVGWDYVLDRGLLRRALHETVSAYPLADARVRFDVLAGPAEALGSESRTLVGLSPLILPSAELIERGASVELIDDLRREKPLVKDAEFVITRRVYPVGGADGPYEHVMLDDDGRLLEGTTSNFFAVKNGTLFTAGAGVLEGITRRFILRLARAAGAPVDEVAVTKDDVPGLDEAFIASSVRSIVPVTKIDGAPVGDGRPGPLTRRLLEEYLAFAHRDARPAVE